MGTFRTIPHGTDSSSSFFKYSITHSASNFRQAVRVGSRRRLLRDPLGTWVARAGHLRRAPCHRVRSVGVHKGIFEGITTRSRGISTQYEHPV